MPAAKLLAPFDVVAANISAFVLKNAAEGLARAVKPGAPAILSGILQMGAADVRTGMAKLRGLEGEADSPAARQLARVLAWADLYLLSSLVEDDVEELGMIALGRPEEARRLVEAGGTCLFLSQAELTRAEAAEDAE